MAGWPSSADIVSARRHTCTRIQKLWSIGSTRATDLMVRMAKSTRFVELIPSDGDRCAPLCKAVAVTNFTVEMHRCDHIKTGRIDFEGRRFTPLKGHVNHCGRSDQASNRLSGESYCNVACCCLCVCQHTCASRRSFTFCMNVRATVIF